MKRIYVYCEGQTEESFVKTVLADYFARQEIYLTPILCNISSSRKGGVSKFSIIKSELTKICRKDKSAVVTTMLDYYGLPSDTPGVRDEVHGDIYAKVKHVEQKMLCEIGEENLLPNLILHEYEGLLFSNPQGFLYCESSARKLQEIIRIRESFQTPEHINNSPQTAPSKRVLSIYPGYSKVTDGVNIAIDIGLDKIRQECPHFNEWMEALLK